MEGWRTHSIRFNCWCGSGDSSSTFGGRRRRRRRRRGGGRRLHQPSDLLNSSYSANSLVSLSGCFYVAGFWASAGSIRRWRPPTPPAGGGDRIGADLRWQRWSGEVN